MCQRFKVGEHHSYMLSKELVKFHAIGAQKKKTHSKEVGIKNAIQRPPQLGDPLVPVKAAPVWVPSKPLEIVKVGKHDSHMFKECSCKVSIKEEAQKKGL